MIEVKISSIDPKKSLDSMFGDDKVLIKYKPPGSRSFQTRSVGDDYQATKIMLERMVEEIMRQAFPHTDPKLKSHVALVPVETGAAEEDSSATP